MESEPTVQSDPTTKSDPSAIAGANAPAETVQEPGPHAQADSSREPRPAASAGATAPPAAASGKQGAAAVRWLKACAGAIGRNPGRTAKIIGALLLVVIVIQNGEPTGIDVLFWSVPPVPKLVLMLICMLIGAVIWEIIRRSRRREHDSSRPG